MLKYLEDSEDLKVGLGEMKEQLETMEEAGISIMQIAQQAKNERAQKLFQIFRQEENASSARFGGAGKALSGSDAGGGSVKRQTRSCCWHGGWQEEHAERSTQKLSREGLRGFQGVCCKDWEDRER